MSTIISDSGAIQKCSSKIVEPNESTKNGLVNGMLHKKNPQMDKAQHGEIAEPVENLSLQKVNESKDLISDQAESCKEEDSGKSNIDKSTRKAKKKKLKIQLDSNENLKDINEPMPDGSVPSSSKDSGCVASEEICGAISSGIEKLVTNDNTVKTLELPGQDEIREQCNKQVEFVPYESELQMPMIMKIIQKDLSEPYSIYTYRYFIHNWPKLCFLAMADGQCVGAIVCKLDLHRKVIRRGYIAMLAVDQNYRKLRIGSTLVQMAIHEMINGNADEVVLETEVTNKPALKLYEKLGFVRDKRLFRYYLNGVDALRLKLWLR